MAGTPLDNLKEFSKLRNTVDLGNIVFVTTMWEGEDGIRDKKKGRRRQAELTKHYFGKMTTRGSQVYDYHTTDSAWFIFDDFFDDKFATLLEAELDDLPRDLLKSERGASLCTALHALLKKQREAAEGIRVHMRVVHDNPTDAHYEKLAALEDDYDSGRVELVQNFQEMQKLHYLFGQLTSRILWLRRDTRVPSQKSPYANAATSNVLNTAPEIQTQEPSTGADPNSQMQGESAKYSVCSVLI